MVERINRVSEEIKKEISDIIANEVKDPRIPDMLSILEADVAKDFGHAKIYYSVLCSDEEKNQAEKALNSASGFIRRELGNRIKLRRIPELHFIADNSIERVIHMNKLISDTMKDDISRKNTLNTASTNEDHNE